MNVSLPLVWANLGLLGLLLVVKMVAKSAAVYPLARRFARLHAAFTILLMSTGLTFGTISATYGFTAGIITRAQFCVLVCVVVLTAVLPTAIAQRFVASTPPPSAPGPRSHRPPVGDAVSTPPPRPERRCHETGRPSAAVGRLHRRGRPVHHRPLYTEVVHRVHRAGLAGASALRGIEGWADTVRTSPAVPVHRVGG